MILRLQSLIHRMDKPRELADPYLATIELSLSNRRAHVVELFEAVDV
jgi:hypothetical protein